MIKGKIEMKIQIGCIFLIVTGGLCACQFDKKQEGVLEKEELAKVLVELYAGEARMANTVLVNDSAYKLFLPFQEALLKKNDLPDSIIKITYHYYLEHPIELEQVYDIVIDTLSLREQKAGTIKPK